MSDEGDHDVNEYPGQERPQEGNSNESVGVQLEEPQVQEQQQPQQQVLPPPEGPPHPPLFHPPCHPSAAINPPPPVMAPAIPHQQQALEYYEARMRDHAAAYATAAAGAAWAAAQIAAQAAEFAMNATSCQLPPQMVPPPMYLPDGRMHYGGMPPLPPGTVVDPNNFHYYNNNTQNNPVAFRQQQGYPHHQQQQQQQHQCHQQEQGNEDYDYSNEQNNGRKRAQPRPPGGIRIPTQPQLSFGRSNNSSNNSNINNNNTSNNNGSRVRRRLRDGGDSSNSSCSGSLGTSITSYNSDQAMGNYSSNYGSGFRKGTRGGGRGHYHRYKKKQRQPIDDSSLLGKSAVAALHEFCTKRRMNQPSFVLVSDEDDLDADKKGNRFEMAVYLEGNEWGRGKGPTKGATKHDAARKALLALIPGVIFDPESGILVELPPMTDNTGKGRLQRHNPEASALLEDLAPNLEKRLAIATRQDEDYDDASNSSRPSKVHQSSNKLKRAWNLYPGTTTSTGTSEEDDENAYYESRGASVCSALLHAMVQIDLDIPESPNYSYEVSKVPTANTQMKRKGPVSSSNRNEIVVHRGSSFTCKATLKVLRNQGAHQLPDESSSKPAQAQSKEEETSKQSDVAINDANKRTPEGDRASEIDESKDNRKRIGQLKGDRGSDEESKPHDEIENGDDDQRQHTVILEAVGVGITKREAKHKASAKILMQLFPECETMLEVKAAAEAARERYAKKKNAVNQSNRRFIDSQQRGSSSCYEKRAKSPRLSSTSHATELRSAFCTADDPQLPEHLKEKLSAVLGQKRPKHQLSSVSCQVVGLEKLNLNQDSPDNPEDTAKRRIRSYNAQESISRQLSRQKQLEEQVDKALQALNEHDEEGRSLPDELTVDDVGRLVLRRAETDDLSRIQKLLPKPQSLSSQPTTGDNATPSLSPLSILGATLEGRCSHYTDQVHYKHSENGLPLSLWSSSTFVLLLCRAIAAFEDPPLGCAVLTLGFSPEKGRLLRIAQIGSEIHLPTERFLECLEGFAACMDCSLERRDDEPLQGSTLKSAGLRLCKSDLRAIIESHVIGDSRTLPSQDFASARTPLQSVLEESEGGEDSDYPTETNSKLKGQDKPCKRSRVE